MQLSIGLNYWATKNEAEYKTLIVGLQVAQHVGAARVLIYSNSQLVAQQLSNNFKINNEWLKLYTETFEKLRAEF